MGLKSWLRSTVFGRGSHRRAFTEESDEGGAERRVPGTRQHGDPRSPVGRVPTVVWVNSENYSGSTLLGLMLGSHSEAAFLGELHHLFKSRSSKKSSLRCNRCESKRCPVLDDLSCRDHAALFATLSERTRKRVLVDTSKRPQWTNQFLRLEGIHKRSIFLIRDPRGYCCSRRKRQPDRPLQEILRDWVAKNTKLWRFLCQHQNRLPFTVLTYHELVSDSESALACLCRWLGLAFDPSMVRYWEPEHHALAGNGAVSFFSKRFSTPDADYYRRHWRKPFVDLRWKKELPAGFLDQTVHDPEVRRLLEEVGLEFAEDGLVPRSKLNSQAA